MRVINAEKTIEHYIEKYEMESFLNDDLLGYLQLFHFPAYSNVFFEDDEQQMLYFLVDGQVQCSHYHMNGKLAVIALSNPFCALGDLEILTEERITNNVITTRDTTMLGIASSIIERYGANDPKFLRFIINELQTKLYNKDMLQASHVLPVISRLALFILAHTTDGIAALPVKEDLASLMGITPRHLNRVLKQLVESGTISADYPEVRIIDETALQGTANGE